MQAHTEDLKGRQAGMFTHTGEWRCMSKTIMMQQHADCSIAAAEYITLLDQPQRCIVLHVEPTFLLPLEINGPGPRTGCNRLTTVWFCTCLVKNKIKW